MHMAHPVPILNTPYGPPNPIGEISENRARNKSYILLCGLKARKRKKNG